MNKVILIGNLTRDPEMHTTPNGVNVAQMGLAVSRRFANKEGVRETDFFNIVAWRQTADFCCKYLKKGNRIAVEGSIQMRDYTDKSGAKRTACEIIADSIESLISRQNGEQGTSQQAAQQPTVPSGFTPSDEEDLPF